MAHYVSGFIARFQHTSLAEQRRPGQVICALEQGFGFIPVIEKTVGTGNQPSQVREFHHLTQRLLEWAETQSRSYQIAYIETEYFGGAGDQSAVAWSDGRIAVGPLLSSSDTGYGEDPQQYGAINECLRFLGVLKGIAFDEFDAAGLNRHRTNQAWIEASTP